MLLWGIWLSLELLWVYCEQTNVSWDCSAGTARTFWDPLKETKGSLVSEWFPFFLWFLFICLSRCTFTFFSAIDTRITQLNNALERKKIKKKKNLHLPTPPRTEKSFFFLSNVSVFPKWKENIPKCLRSQFSTWRQTVFWYKNDINHIDVKWLLH